MSTACTYIRSTSRAEGTTRLAGLAQVHLAGVSNLKIWESDLGVTTLQDGATLMQLCDLVHLTMSSPDTQRQPRPTRQKARVGDMVPLHSQVVELWDIGRGSTRTEEGHNTRLELAGSSDLQLSANCERINPWMH
jgi:hypothetical protein